MPAELESAIMIDGLAQRYGCTPIVILDEPVGVLPIIELAAMNEKDRQTKAERKMKETSKRRSR